MSLCRLVELLELAVGGVEGTAHTVQQRSVDSENDHLKKIL